MPIHNIHVDDTSPTFPRGAHLLAQTGKVRRKNRRCQLNQCGLFKPERKEAAREILPCEKLAQRQLCSLLPELTLTHPPVSSARVQHPLPSSWWSPSSFPRSAAGCAPSFCQPL